MEARYRRSVAGWLWLFLTPVAFLGIYWVMFGVVMGLSWTDPRTNSPLPYYLPLFGGLAMFLTFSEIMTSSANLFVSKRSYVKRAPFPVSLLWLSNMMRSSVQGMIYLSVLVVLAAINGTVTFIGMVWLIFAALQFALFMSGVSLLLASFGPFLGDITELLRLLVRILLYAAPVTYPLASVPESIRFYYWLNPLTYIVESVREAVIFSSPPSPGPMSAFVIASLGILAVSTWLFHRVKGAISDVV